MTNPLQGSDEETQRLRDECDKAMRLYGIEITRTALNPSKEQQLVGARAGIAFIATIDALVAHSRSLESALREAQNQIGHFRAGMVNYGHHAERCNAMRSAGPCDCGFHATLDRFATKGRT